jgi:hypothetical protein
MTRQQVSLRKTALVLAATAALAASQFASADDNSMSPLTGDSYAYFNGLEYSLGKFNVAKGAQATTRFAVRRALRGDTMIDVERPVAGAAAKAAPQTLHVTRPNPFRDDTGQ